MISQLGNLQILEKVWVPDWRGKIYQTQHPFFPTIFTVFEEGPQNLVPPVGFFQNFAAAPQTCVLDDDFSADGTLFRLRGFVLSIVQALGNEHKYRSGVGALDSFRTVALEQKAYNSDEHICDIHSNQLYTPTGERMEDVYWQTLVASQHFIDYSDTKKGFQKWNTNIRKWHRYLPSSSKLSFLAMIGQLGVTNLWTKKFVQLRSTSEYKHFQYAMTTSREGRRMFRTKDGAIGLGPGDLKKGDEIVLIKGCRTPIVLRRTEMPSKWSLVGACYLHGFMRGENYIEKQCYDIWLE